MTRDPLAGRSAGAATLRCHGDGRMRSHLRTLFQLGSIPGAAQFDEACSIRGPSLTNNNRTAVLRLQELRRKLSCEPPAVRAVTREGARTDGLFVKKKIKTDPSSVVRAESNLVPNVSGSDQCVWIVRILRLSELEVNLWFVFSLVKFRS